MRKVASTPIPWKRIFAEFVAITGAVYLGLLADDYRDFRAERDAESEYLRLFERDLDRDLEALANTRRGIESQAEAAQLIHSAIGQSNIPIDAVERAFSTLFLTWTYEQQRSTFLGLRDGAELHIIESLQLRSALIDYYEIYQTSLQQDYMTNYSLAQQRLRVGLGRHVRFLPPEEFDLLWPLPDDFHLARLLTSLSELHDDVSFLNEIAEIGARGFELLGEIDRLETENRKLWDELQRFTQ